MELDDNGTRPRPRGRPGGPAARAAGAGAAPSGDSVAAACCSTDSEQGAGDEYAEVLGGAPSAKPELQPPGGAPCTRETGEADVGTAEGASGGGQVSQPAPSPVPETVDAFTGVLTTIDAAGEVGQRRASASTGPLAPESRVSLADRRRRTRPAAAPSVADSDSKRHKPLRALRDRRRADANDAALLRS